MLGGMGGFGVLGMLVPVLFLIGVIVLTVWTVTRIFPNQRDGGGSAYPQKNAEETLRKRFAHSEIGAGEYEGSLKVLRGETHEKSGARSA